MTSTRAVAPTLQADALEKSFMSGDVQVPVLRGLSLEIYPGELTLVSGPSGCGKSTLLSLLSGLSSPDGGRVHALGQDVGHMTRSEVERFRLHHVGFVFQGFNLFPALTALEQVQLPLGYRGMSNRESEPLARRALEEVGLSHRSHMRPAQLSGGEKQRLALARLWFDHAEIVVLDEATSALDNVTEHIVMKNVLAQVKDATVIAIAHRLTSIRDFDKIYVFREGSIVGSGTFSELLEKNAYFNELYQKEKNLM